MAGVGKIKILDSEGAKEKDRHNIIFIFIFMSVTVSSPILNLQF